MRPLVIALLLSAIIGCQGYPGGAPPSACSSLTPVHSKFLPKSSPSPYSVSAVKNGDKVRITISSDVGEDIQGFALQARSTEDENRIIDGKFTTERGVSQTIDCLGGKENTLTHVNPSPKRRILTDWLPSESLQEDVVFRATVAKGYDSFWTDIESQALFIGNEGISGKSRKMKKKESRSMYHNCFVSKGCFGLPSGCIPKANCDVFLSFMKDDKGVSFTMKGGLESENYMAMGISFDSKMGDDAVVECFRKGSIVTMRESWNDGKRNSRTRELSRSSYNGEYIDGMTTCSWSERYLKESNGRRFNLANSTYYVLLAKGPMKNNDINYHTGGRLSSQEAVNFTAFELIEGGRVSDSVKIHGTFMVTAWIGFVSIAILLARHFKLAWESDTLCKVKVWFALHRGMMITALLFMVVAFIVIFIHKNGWNYETDNPHAVLGCIATALALFQPIMAAFRPSPDHSKRKIFNWLHFSVGNLAHLIAVITMFYARKLDSSGLQDDFYWVLGVFLIVHMVFHFIFQMQAWTLSKKKNEIKMVEMTSRGGYNTQNAAPEKDVTHDMFKLLLLGIYSIFLIVIVLTLYALIGIA